MRLDIYLPTVPLFVGYEILERRSGRRRFHSNSFVDWCDHYSRKWKYAQRNGIRAEYDPIWDKDKGVSKLRPFVYKFGFKPVFKEED